MFNVVSHNINKYTDGSIRSSDILATIPELSEAALSEVAEVYDFELDEDEAGFADAFIKFGKREPMIVSIEPVTE